MVQYVIQYKNGTIKYVNVNTKIFISAKKIIVGILADVFICENSKYLKSVAITVYINCHSKKVRECYISHRILLVIILPLIITIICNHYAKKKV